MGERRISKLRRGAYSSNMLNMIELMEFANDALHDLDEADGETSSMQQKCEKIPGLMAEAEAHRTLLMERDATIAAMRHFIQSDWVLMLITAISVLN